MIKAVVFDLDGTLIDSADKLGKKVQSVGFIRNSLISKGMVFSASHGDLQFTVPLFEGFMQRIMPRFS